MLLHTFTLAGDLSSNLGVDLWESMDLHFRHVNAIQAAPSHTELANWMDGKLVASKYRNCHVMPMLWNCFFLLDTEMVFYHDSPCLLFSGHQTSLERQVFSTAPLLHWLHKSVLDSNCRTFCAVLWGSSHVELHLVVTIIVGSLGGLKFFLPAIFSPSISLFLLQVLRCWRSRQDTRGH